MIWCALKETKVYGTRDTQDLGICGSYGQGKKNQKIFKNQTVCCYLVTHSVTLYHLKFL